MVDEVEKDTCPLCVAAIAKATGGASTLVSRSALVRCPQCSVEVCQVHVAAHACVGSSSEPSSSSSASIDLQPCWNVGTKPARCCNAPECPRVTARLFCCDRFLGHRAWACSKSCMTAPTGARKISKEWVPKTCLECVKTWHQWRGDSEPWSVSYAGRGV